MALILSTYDNDDSSLSACVFIFLDISGSDEVKLCLSAEQHPHSHYTASSRQHWKVELCCCDILKLGSFFSYTAASMVAGVSISLQIKVSFQLFVNLLGLKFWCKLFKLTLYLLLKLKFY